MTLDRTRVSLRHVIFRIHLGGRVAALCGNLGVGIVTSSRMFAALVMAAATRRASMVPVATLR